LAYNLYSNLINSHRDQFIRDSANYLSARDESTIKGRNHSFADDYNSKAYSISSFSIQKSHKQNNISSNHQDIFYCYDKTDCKNSGWYGVILRNIDENCSIENLYDFLMMITSEILYTTKFQSVLDSLCCIVVTEDLDDAEKIVLHFNDPKKCGSDTPDRIKVK